MNRKPAQKSHAPGGHGMLRAGRRRLDWRKRMSDNIAFALLAYTALQIVLTMGVLRARGASVLPFAALVILVAGIIPACRRFERRWSRLGDAEAADPALVSRYRRDVTGLWALALGLPFAIAGVFRLLALLFA